MLLYIFHAFSIFLSIFPTRHTCITSKVLKCSGRTRDETALLNSIFGPNSYFIAGLDVVNLLRSRTKIGNVQPVHFNFLELIKTRVKFINRKFHYYNHRSTQRWFFYVNLCSIF